MKLILISLFLIVNLFSDMKIYVSHSSHINSISLQELKNLYLKKTKLLHHEKVLVYDNTDEYSEFYTQVIGKTNGQLHAYWMKQIFSGNRIPPSKTTSSELLKILNSNPFAISYSRTPLDAKVIYETK